MEDNSVEISFKDAETDEVFNLRLSPKSASRAQSDLTYATTLLNAARQAFDQTFSVGVEASEGAMEDSASMDDTVENINISDMAGQEDTQRLTEDKENFRWSEAAIFLLLDEYRLRESSLSSGKMSHKKVWLEISERMVEKGHSVSDKQCMTRINTMKRTYKAIKDHNGRSGNNRRTWKYYANMESLLGEKPYMAPLKTLSSTGTSTTSRERSESPCSSGSSSSQPQEFPRKRKATDALEQLLRSREAAEERKEIRHKERMALQLKISEKLDNLLKKL